MGAIGLAVGLVVGAYIVQGLESANTSTQVGGSSPSVPTQQPAIPTTASSSFPLINRISLGSDAPLADLVSEIIRNPQQSSQAQLENAVRNIQAEADHIDSGRLESNSIDVPQDNWWLVWCSNVPSKYYDGIPTGWYYLFEQRLPTFGQLFVISPTSQYRRLDSCNSPQGWWGVVVYRDNP
jgi:hypothetical protein